MFVHTPNQILFPFTLSSLVPLSLFLVHVLHLSHMQGQCTPHLNSNLDYLPLALCHSVCLSLSLSFLLCLYLYLSLSLSSPFSPVALLSLIHAYTASSPTLPRHPSASSLLSLTHTISLSFPPLSHTFYFIHFLLSSRTAAAAPQLDSSALCALCSSRMAMLICTSYSWSYLPLAHTTSLSLSPPLPPPFCLSP